MQCFDLRRGNSLAENLVSLGYPTYLVDYGWIRFSDRDLGLEHWVEDVIPAAVEAVREDSGADQVQLVGWCLGGIMSLLSVADGRVPASSVAMVASPFDFTRVRLMAPVRRLAGLTGGALGTALYRALGGAPSPLVRIGFQLTSIDRYLTKPLWMAQNIDNREALAQTEAVDRFMANMIAYPGRTFGQLYHQFFRVNELSGGRLTMSGGEIDLANVDVPVLSVAGNGDVLAPRPAVHHVGNLLPNAPDVRLETAVARAAPRTLGRARGQRIQAVRRALRACRVWFTDVWRRRGYVPFHTSPRTTWRQTPDFESRPHVGAGIRPPSPATTASRDADTTPSSLTVGFEQPHRSRCGVPDRRSGRTLGVDRRSAAPALAAPANQGEVGVAALPDLLGLEGQGPLEGAEPFGHPAGKRLEPGEFGDLRLGPNAVVRRLDIGIEDVVAGHVAAAPLLVEPFELLAVGQGNVSRRRSGRAAPGGPERPRGRGRACPTTSCPRGRGPAGRGRRPSRSRPPAG